MSFWEFSAQNSWAIFKYWHTTVDYGLQTVALLLAEWNNKENLRICKLNINNRVFAICTCTSRIFRRSDEFFANFRETPWVVGVFTVLLASLLMPVLLASTISSIPYVAGLPSAVDVWRLLMLQLRVPAAVAGVPAKCCCLLYCCWLSYCLILAFLLLLTSKMSLLLLYM